MNVDSILNFRKDSEEDFYALLGCDPSASPEQITAEYKARVKDCHPDKNRADPASQEKFQKLLRVSTIPYLFETRTLDIMFPLKRLRKAYVILGKEKCTMTGEVRVSL